MDIGLERLDGVEGYVMGRRIVLDIDTYPPRRNWIFCHELAHVLLGHQKVNRITPEMEWEADELAAELMLPIDQFRSAMISHDIPALKDMFPHASWEVIARRWAKERQVVLTIYDNRKLTGRYGPEETAFPSRPTDPEVELIRECYEAKQAIKCTTEGEIKLDLQAYFIDEGRGVERVLLLTESLMDDL